MSRHGYNEDGWDSQEAMWAWIRWRGSVTSALRGKRGQAFLRRLIAALDAMPVKRLAGSTFQSPEGEFCVLASLLTHEGKPLPPTELFTPNDDDYDDEVDTDALADWLAVELDISPRLAQEIMYHNDECWDATKEDRFARMRRWATSNLKVLP